MEKVSEILFLITIVSIVFALGGLVGFAFRGNHNQRVLKNLENTNRIVTEENRQLKKRNRNIERELGNLRENNRELREGIERIGNIADSAGEDLEGAIGTIEEFEEWLDTAIRD